MTSGKHFNHKLLEEAANHYDNNYDEFGAGYEFRYESPKNKLCWQKIFGYVERFVPGSDGQVIAQGPWAILDNGEQSDRSLNFKWGGGRYFPLDLDPIWEVGHNCAGIGERAHLAAVGGGVGIGFNVPGARFKSYVEQKQKPLLCEARQSTAEVDAVCNTLTV